MKKILIPIITLVALVGCGGADERKAAYMEKANQSYEAGDFEKAKIDIKNVLQIDPKHSEATFLLGLLAEIDRDYRKAVGLYNLAIELDPNNTKARYNLGKFFLQLSDNEKAQEQADKIEAITPGSSLAKALSGAIAFGEKKYTDAIEILKEIKMEHRSEDVFILIAASHYGSGDVGETIKSLVEGIEKYNKSVALRIILARTYIEEEKKEEALEYLNQIIAIEPTNPAHYRTLSNYYEKLGDAESARKVYFDLVNNDPENEIFQLLLIQYIADKDGQAAAVSHLTKLIPEYPDVEAYAILHAKFELKSENKSQAIGILEGIIKRGITEKGVHNAKNMLASIKAYDGDVASAKVILNEVLATVPSDVDANFLLAKILLTENEPGEAIGSLRVVIRENEKNSEAYLLLAKAHELLGEKNLVHDVIAQGYRENPKNQFLENNYIKLLLETGKHEYALNVVESSQSHDDISPDTKILRSKVYLANGSYSSAVTLGKELIEAYPDKDTGYQILADSYAKQSYFDKTKDVLKQGIEATDSVGLMVPYIKLLVQLEQSDDAMSFLNSYSGKSKNSPLISTMLAELYVAKDDVPSAVKYYKEAIELKPKWDMPYFALGILHTKRGNTSEAIETYKSAVEHIVDSTKAKIMLATAYHKDGNIEKSADLYREIIEKDPDNALIINNLALILANNSSDKASLDEALSLVQKLKDIPNPAVKDTVAWVYVKNAKYDEAIEIFNEIVETRSDIGVFKYHLGMAHYHKGDTALARQYLEEAVSIKEEGSWRKEANDLINKLKQG